MRKKHPFIKKNDNVIFLAGKEKGKIGNVLNVDSESERAIIEKINLVKRHSKPSAQNAQGGIIEKEASIHLSNIMLVCNRCTEPSRIGIKILEDGSKVRICKKCSEQLSE